MVGQETLHDAVIGYVVAQGARLRPFTGDCYYLALALQMVLYEHGIKTQLAYVLRQRQCQHVTLLSPDRTWVLDGNGVNVLVGGWASFTAYRGVTLTRPPSFRIAGWAGTAEDAGIVDRLALGLRRHLDAAGVLP